MRNVFWFNDFLHGSPIGRQYREIKYLSECSYTEGLPFRLEKLRNLLCFVKQTSLFYCKLTCNNLKDYPVMNKLSYIENYDRLKVAEDKIPGQ